LFGEFARLNFDALLHFNSPAFVMTPPAKAGGFSEERLLAITAASRTKLGSSPKVLPTLAYEGPIRAAWQITSLCAAGPRTTLLPWVFYVQEVFPAQPREHPVLKVPDQRTSCDAPSGMRSRAFRCHLKQAVPCPES
jgi:hypothetical protein